MNTRLTAVVSALAFFAVTGVAQAGTASLTFPPCADKEPCQPGSARYVAAAGEVNRVTVATRANAYVFRDEGATVTAGPGCTRVDDHEATCAPVFYSVILKAELGDRDDTGTLAATTGSIDGGDGADVLTITGAGAVHGGAGADALTGGEGNDQLGGGPGVDAVTGGGGDDTLLEGDDLRAADRLDGGAGADAVSYVARAGAVTVDLADPAPDGEAGENDVLASIEGAFGGKGADRLSGDATANRLAGGDGNDVLLGLDGDDILGGGVGDDTLTGGAGNDDLEGNEGRDRFDAGPGDDFLAGWEIGAETSRDAVTETLQCGDGDDRIEQILDRVGSDCERMGDGDYFGTQGAGRREDVLGFGLRPFPVARAARELTFAVPCPSAKRARGKCRIRAVVRTTDGKRRLGRTQKLVRARGGRLRVPLTRDPGALVRVDLTLERPCRSRDAECRLPRTVSYLLVLA